MLRPDLAPELHRNKVALVRGKLHMQAQQSWSSRRAAAAVEYRRVGEQAFGSGASGNVVPLSDVSLAVGTPAFGEALQWAVNAAVTVDQCIIITFFRRVPSGYLLTVGKGDFKLSVRLIEDFAAGGNVGDSKLRYIQAGGSRPGIVPFSPTEWQGRFRRRFVDRGGVVDNVPCIAARGERMVSCNFMRVAPSSAYDERERVRLGEIIPVLANLALANYALCGPFAPLPGPPPSIKTPDDEVALLRERLGHSPLDCLTERERQVCFRILLGYSSEAIGLHLGVARSTVISHRKRAYERLGIVSQSELFSLYLHSLPEFRPEPQPGVAAPSAAPLRCASLPALRAPAGASGTCHCSGTSQRSLYWGAESPGVQR